MQRCSTRYSETWKKNTRTMVQGDAKKTLKIVLKVLEVTFTEKWLRMRIDIAMEIVTQ